MSVGVSNINDPLCIHKNAVESFHTAMHRRFTFGTIAFLAVAGQEFQSTCLPVDHPHAVALSVGQINISLWTHSNAFGSGQRRGLGRATITGKTFFPSACFVVNGAATGSATLVQGVIDGTVKGNVKSKVSSIHKYEYNTV